MNSNDIFRQVNRELTQSIAQNIVNINSNDARGNSNDAPTREDLTCAILFVAFVSIIILL